MSLEAKLARIEAAHVRVTSASRNSTDCGPFRVMLHPSNDLVWLNYAVPTSAAYTSGSVGEMIDEFLNNGRTPRLEFTRELWPALPGLLEDEGFGLEATQPTRICTESEFRPFRADAVSVRMLSAGDDLEPVLTVANEAFGMAEGPTPEQIEANRDQILRGVLKCAGAYIDGAVAGCAFTTPCDGVCELAGVGTAPAFRRRGVASAVSSFLMADHFLTGDLVWLSAGDDAAKAVYERLGFETVATHVCYVRP